MSANNPDLCEEKPIQCPYCFGRGYRPRYRPNGKLGFYAETCRPCQGTAQIQPDWPNYKRAKAKGEAPA